MIAAQKARWTWMMFGFSHVLIVLVAIVVFVVDLLIPLGVAVPTLYVLAVLLAMPLQNRRLLIATAIGTSLLTILGLFLSPPADDIVMWKVLLNRGISLFAIGVTAGLSVRQQSLLVYRQLNARLRQILESLPTGMVMIDRAGMITLVNQAMSRMFGYEESEVLGQPIERLIPERFLAHHPALRMGYFADPQPRAMGASRDLFGLRKDGTEFPVELGLSPVEIKDELMVLGSIIDITERKRAESEALAFSADLERSNEELDEFAYVASHDLRSPLAAIKNLAKWIQEDNAENLPEKSRKHLLQMNQRVSRLERLLDDLLQYSRAGRKHWQVERVDTNKLVREIATLLNPPRSVTITVASQVPVFETARTPLELVFRNLIGNSIKHRKRDDLHIDVSCQANGEFYEFAVADNGPGIDSQFHTQIFKLFETLRVRDEVEASGMGLAIIKKTVESYGGTIRVESALGQGATFRFTWPKTPRTNSTA